MPFDPFNPDNTAYGANPSSSMINSHGAYGSAPIHPAYARAFSTDQFNIPGPQYFTPSSYGVFRPTISPAGPSPYQYATPPSLLQSFAQYNGILPAPTGQMPIEFQGQAAKGLGLGAMKLGSTVAEFGSSMLVGAMMKRAGYGMASTLIGSTGVGLALTAPLSMMVKRQEKITELQAQTRGLVSSGNDLDPSGRGLSMSASTDLFKQFTSMSTENYRFNRDDLRKLTETGRKAGLFQFSGSSGNEIGKAIKNISDTIVAFSQIVESGSLDEAAQVLGDFQKLGISQKQSSAVGRTMRRFSRMAGVETGELIATSGNVGAEAFVRHGLAGGVGLQVGGMTQGLANMAARAGNVDPMTLSMLGGVSGFSQMGTNFMADVFGSDFQKMFLPGLVSSKNGKLEFDKSKMDNFLSGKTSMLDLLGGAGKLDQHQVADIMRNSPTIMSKGLQQMTPEQQISAVQRVVMETQKIMGPGTTLEEALMAKGVEGTQVEGIKQMFFNPDLDRRMRGSKERQDIEDKHQQRRLRIEENSLYAKAIRGVRKVGAGLEKPILDHFNKPINEFLDYTTREQFDAYSPKDSYSGGLGLGDDMDFLNRATSGRQTTSSQQLLSDMTGQQLGGRRLSATSPVRNTMLNRLVGGLAASDDWVTEGKYSKGDPIKGAIRFMANKLGGRINAEDIKLLETMARNGDEKAAKIVRESVSGFGNTLTGGSEYSLSHQTFMAQGATELYRISQMTDDDLTGGMSSEQIEEAKTASKNMRTKIRTTKDGAAMLRGRLQLNINDDPALSGLSTAQKEYALNKTLNSDDMSGQMKGLKDSSDAAETMREKTDWEMLNAGDREKLIENFGGRGNFEGLLKFAADKKLNGKDDVKDAVLYGTYLNASDTIKESMRKEFGSEVFDRLDDKFNQEDRDTLKGLTKGQKLKGHRSTYRDILDSASEAQILSDDARTGELAGELHTGFGEGAKGVKFEIAKDRNAFLDKLIDTGDLPDDDQTARLNKLLPGTTPQQIENYKKAIASAKRKEEQSLLDGPTSRPLTEEERNNSRTALGNAALGAGQEQSDRLAAVMGAAQSVKLDPESYSQLEAIAYYTKQMASRPVDGSPSTEVFDVNQSQDRRAMNDAVANYGQNMTPSNQVINQTSY